MKNPSLERLRIQARQYHRHHTWALAEGGIHVRHVYQPELALLWWSDYGFVLNGRRVMIWWVHPRMKYADEISDRASQKTGPQPDEANGLLDTKAILKRETTLAEAFPSYQYGLADWLAESAEREKDRTMANASSSLMRRSSRKISTTASLITVGRSKKVFRGRNCHTLHLNVTVTLNQNGPISRTRQPPEKRRSVTLAPRVTL